MLWACEHSRIHILGDESRRAACQATSMDMGRGFPLQLGRELPPSTSVRGKYCAKQHLQTQLVQRANFGTLLPLSFSPCSMGRTFNQRRAAEASMLISPLTARKWAGCDLLLGVGACSSAFEVFEFSFASVVAASPGGLQRRAIDQSTRSGTAESASASGILSDVSERSRSTQPSPPDGCSAMMFRLVCKETKGSERTRL